MKDKRPQFIPGYLAACARTPILTAGELPGGGDLFRTCTRAVVEIQTSLGPEFYADLDDTTPEAGE